MNKFFLILFSFYCIIGYSQTTIINSSGNGGFESGTTFALNGWTTVNNATNAWYLGTAPSGYSGSRCAYISNNSGTSNAYTLTTSQVSHFYRDVTFPAGETNITLTFNWLGNGESTYDYLRVFVVPTTTTPVAGTQLATGQVGSTYYNLQTTWQTATITLSGAYAGTTQRLVFSWRNDNSAGAQPPAAVDNISLISQSPPPPPSNDACANATSLPCGTTNLAGTTVNTVLETSPGGCASQYGVWYTFTGNGQSTTITSTASGFDHEIDIFSGTCGSLTSISCVDAAGSGGTETYTFTSVSTTQYFAYIAHYSTSSTTTGTFTISRSCAAPQEGQDCGWAPTVCSSEQISGNSSGPGNFSDLSALNRGCLTGNEHQSQWLYFQAQADGVISFSLNPENGIDDYDFAIWGGLDCPPSGQPIRCSYAAAYKQLESGYGPDCFSFVVNNGDVIVSDYQAGFYPDEERFIIYDHNGVEVANSGWDPVNINYTVNNCPGGNCQYSLCLEDNYGDGWDGIVFLLVNGLNPFASTGLVDGAGDDSEDSFGDGFVNSITVTAGETYTILIDNYYSTTNPYYFDWDLGGGASLDCSTLPVDLLYFTGNCNQNAIRLDWETASERNNDYFLVEKSFNGIDYFSIGTLKGAGTSTGFNFKYYLLDNSEKSDLQYYRLSQFDFNGKKEVFEPIIVTCDEVLNESVEIIARNKNADVVFKEKMGKQYQILVVDALGQILSQESVSIVSNNQFYNIPIEIETNQVINIVVKGFDEIYSEKIIYLKDM